MMFAISLVSQIDRTLRYSRPLEGGILPFVAVFDHNPVLPTVDPPTSEAPEENKECENECSAWPQYLLEDFLQFSTPLGRVLIETLC